jgi:hypothetical protein
VKRSLALSALLCPLLCAAAETLPDDGAREKWLDFGVVFSKNKTQFDYADTSIATTVETISLHWYERVAPRWDIGLHGGYSFLTQTDYALTAGLEPRGYHAGVGIRGTLWEMAAGELFLNASYLYHRLNHDEGTQSITLSWYQPEVRLGFVTRHIGRLRLLGGATAGAIDGQERAEGTIDRTLDFERDLRGGGFLGLDLTVERDGHVGIEIRNGVERGGRIYFTSSF